MREAFQMGKQLNEVPAGCRHTPASSINSLHFFANQKTFPLFPVPLIKPDLQFSC